MLESWGGARGCPSHPTCLVGHTLHPSQTLPLCPESGPFMFITCLHLGAGRDLPVLFWSPRALSAPAPVHS